MKEFTYEVTNVIATLSISPKNGWHKRLCRVSWGGRTPKLDIREWAPDKAKGRVMSKGVTLSDDEARALRQAICSLNLSDDISA